MGVEGGGEEADISRVNGDHPGSADITRHVIW